MGEKSEFLLKLGQRVGKANRSCQRGRWTRRGHGFAVRESKRLHVQEREMPFDASLDWAIDAGAVKLQTQAPGRGA